MTSKIKVIRLITGEEILAEEIISSKTSITIENPLRLVVAAAKADPSDLYSKLVPTVNFLPWIEFSENRQFTLDKSHVLVVYDAVKQLSDYHDSVFKAKTPQLKSISSN